MCGIAGILTAESPESSVQGPVRAMTDRMRKRGPDGEGIWTGKGVVLGHRRLAILDPNVRANQPMSTADGRYTIVFNGEIYNFRHLRAGFEVPMESWIKSAGEARTWERQPLLAQAGTPRARLWAYVILQSGFDQSPPSVSLQTAPLTYAN